MSKHDRFHVNCILDNAKNDRIYNIMYIPLVYNGKPIQYLIVVDQWIMNPYHFIAV